MTDTGFSTSDAVLTSAMSGGFNRGAGNWGGGYGGHAPFAGPASNAVRINRNNDAINSQNQFTRDILKGSIDANGRDFDLATLYRHFSDVKTDGFAQEIRLSDKIDAVAREDAANARKADECCCKIREKMADDKVQILASAARDKAEIIAKIDAIKDRELNAANAKITQLETINALSDHGHHRRGGRGDN